MSVILPLLLTGSTGYIGGQLLRALEKKKIPVRCLTRRPQVLAGRVLPTTEIVTGDALHPESLKKALSGIHTAFYLMRHPVTRNFEEKEYAAAKHFAHASAVHKLQKIIYLSRLGDASPATSRYLRSRQKIGEILLSSGVPVVEFRSSAIIGPGSRSFERMRAWVDRFPVMVTPRWVHTLAQPIALEDTLAYLIEAISYRGSSKMFEIGGPEKVSYAELMKEYARQRGLKRWHISVPADLTRLSRRWLDYVAPDYSATHGQWLECMRAASVVTHHQALRVFRVRPRSYPEAIAEALRN